MAKETFDRSKPHLNIGDQHAQTRDDQERCLKALKFKCSMLWSMLDAVASAYHLGGTIPPGAWDPSTQVGLLSQSA